MFLFKLYCQVKNTLWEGGVRGAGVLWSPRLRAAPRVARQRLHLVDWLPTLLAAAGANCRCEHPATLVSIFYWL